MKALRYFGARDIQYGSIEDRSNRRKWKELKKKISGKLDAQTPPGRGRSGLTDAQHKDGKNVRQVVQWLQTDTPDDKPFFIACGIQKPHVPFLAPDKYFDLYPENTGLLVQPGQTVTFNLHYFPRGEGVEGAYTEVGLWFYPKDFEPKYKLRAATRVFSSSGVP